jgi:DNA-binding NtrC family response regulator
MNAAVRVVEDEPLIRFVLVDALEDKGLQIIEAAFALEAVGLLSKHPEIGVVFTDVDMPGGLNGVDLAKLIANVYPQIGILVTSGRYYDVENELPEGARFLPKPYSLSTVHGQVLALMPEKRQIAGR